MRKMAYQMRNFASFNQKNKNTGLFVREIECEETPDCFIDVWEKRKKLPFMSFEPSTEIKNLQIKGYSHNTVKIKWNVTEEGISNISNYKIEVSSVSAVDTIESEIKVSPGADETMTNVITNLRPGHEYKISVQILCLNDHAFSKSVFLNQMTRQSNPSHDFMGEVRDRRHVKLAWENPNIKLKSAVLKGFIIEYNTPNGKWLPSKLVPSDVKSYSLLNLSYCTEYKFRILACYDGEKDTLPSEDIKLKTEPMELPQSKKVQRYFRLILF